MTAISVEAKMSLTCLQAIKDQFYLSAAYAAPSLWRTFIGRLERKVDDTLRAAFLASNFDLDRVSRAVVLVRTEYLA